MNGIQIYTALKRRTRATRTGVRLYHFDAAGKFVTEQGAAYSFAATNKASAKRKFKNRKK